ncbi:hypothetical protein DFP72DRAFT_297287 [Ephemerocybe angulata]|uniref:Uncharacterized protein n=1 Tax=Ephemerocybe angulata TaxID=980116 RepID=A0A8H6LT22_9AGAR|nr:hypothetical protein DFP72DRAFT_297287 [Tulosesus angulatus]
MSVSVWRNRPQPCLTATTRSRSTSSATDDTCTVVVHKLGWGHLSNLWLARVSKQNRHFALKVVKSAPRYTEDGARRSSSCNASSPPQTRPQRPRPAHTHPLPSFAHTHPGRSHVI